MSIIRNEEQLLSIYGEANEASTLKVTTALTEEYERFVAASPFVTLATCGPEGLDCSPRGDSPGFVRVVDASTLHLPDRRGNNRVDSLRNIVRDPRVALLFLLPGSGTTLRINGDAHIDATAELCESFSVQGTSPRSVIVIRIHEVYFQCARAILRAKLWDSDSFVDPSSVPTPGEVLDSLSQGRIAGDEYDREWPERAKRTLW